MESQITHLLMPWLHNPGGVSLMVRIDSTRARHVYLSIQSIASSVIVLRSRNNELHPQGTYDSTHYCSPDSTTFVRAYRRIVQPGLMHFVCQNHVRRQVELPRAWFPFQVLVLKIRIRSVPCSFGGSMSLF